MNQITIICSVPIVETLLCLLVEQLPEPNENIVLLDVAQMGRMPEFSGSRVVLFTASADPGYLTAAKTAGADGFWYLHPSAEELARVTGPELKLEGGNAQVVSEPTETGFTVCIKYNGAMDQTDPGDYTLTIGATYTNEDGVSATPAPAVRNFSVIRRAVEGLSLQLTGGQSDYPLTQLEELAVYEAQLFLNDQPITGEAFSRVSNVTASILGGNALAEVEAGQDRFLIRICYNGTAADTTVGEYTLNVTADYTNEDGQNAQAQAEPTVFTITDDTSDLGVLVEMEQDFYAQTQMGAAKPICVKLTYAGAPLTAEQFAVTKLTVNIDKLAAEAYRVDADPANSQYIVTLIKNDALKNGKHTLQATADSLDEVGREICAKGSGKFTVSPCPAWMIVLFWVLIGLLILALIWAYLNMKILPKQIGVGKGTFSVEGELITGKVRCSFSGKNKKKGFVEITSPQCMTNPLAKCGFKLELEAISPRRTKSAARRARVVGITPLNPVTTTSLVIGSWRMAKDPVSGKLVKVGGRPNAPVDFNIGNNCSTTIVAEIMDLTDGGEIACSLSVPLKFY